MYKVIKYIEKEHFEIWDNFVNNSINGTIFHLRKFINYHHKDKFTDDSLLIFDGNKLISVFPAATVKKDYGLILKSHPGTSYGGPVFSKSVPLKIIFDIIKAIEEYAISQDYNVIEFRESPKIFYRNPFDQLDFALLHNNYKREDEELSTCYPLKQYKGLSIDEMLNKFDKSGRNKIRKNVRKALRNEVELKIIPDNEIEIYYNILLTNLKKHNATPAHSLEEIRKLRQLFPERIKLYGVYKNNVLIAGYVIFNINSKGNHVFYASIDYDYQDLRPTTFGLVMLQKKFADENYEYLNMGISTEDGGKTINWGLFDFKESFNGTGILRTYWQKFLK
jgi:hypothetical protein